MKEFVDNLDTLDPILYNHEKLALTEWNKKLKSGVSKKEAKIYDEIFQVYMKTIEKRINEKKLINISSYYKKK